MRFIVFNVHVQPVFLNLIIVLPTISPPSQPKYAHVENDDHNKILDHYNGWIIMKFLDNKTPKVEFENICVLILSGMSNNNAELVKVNGYGAISSNDESENNFTLFALHVSHIHSKKMWNQMEINWHLVTLFAMKYIHHLEFINQVFMSIHIKDK